MGRIVGATGRSARHRRARLAFAVPVALVTAGLTVATAPTAAAATTTTAYSGGTFHLDVPNVVRESNIVLAQPNLQAAQAMPLGNGSAGAAVWAAGGLTAQLNRDDTFPDRKSPGQINVPGLAAMTNAPDYKGSLDLYSGTFVQTGGGITATTYLRADKDELVVDVSGVAPGAAESVVASQPVSTRTPTAAVSADGTVGSLAETWTDNSTGGDGSTWGTLLGITANGQNVAASVTNSKTVAVTFKANANGTFKVLVAVPTWKGGTGPSAAQTYLGADASASSTAISFAHTAWWTNYWNTAKLMQLSSSDGVAQYMENLRTLYLYDQGSLMRGQYPGSQAGTAPLFSFSGDTHQWVPADYWWWNIRMQAYANLGAGVGSLNQSIFDLYTGNVSTLQAWNAAHVPGNSGICVPETMRYNGTGDYGGWTANASCDTTIAASYNSQTFSSGGEIIQMMWQQYQQTGDATQLAKEYPFMKAVAQFYLSLGTVGADGYRHFTGNEHEQQWAVTDPSMTLSAEATSLPIVAQVATILGQDPALVTSITTAIGQIPPLTRTDAATRTQVVRDNSQDENAAYILALSAQPNASVHNTENTQLESIWPFGQIGDTGAMHDIGVNSFNKRLYSQTNDWSYNSVYAARLGLASSVASELTADTKKFQSYINGMATLSGGVGTEFYNEQQGIVALALNEALVQDYDGTLRITPAWPSAWNVSGSVAIQNRSSVDVQYSGGVLSTVLLEAGANGNQVVRNPWSGQQVQVEDVTANTEAVAATSAATFTVPTVAGHNYLIQQVSSPTTALPYAPVTGTPATAARHLGSVQIGLDAAPAPATFSTLFNNVGITLDTNTGVGNFDGGNASFSYQALLAAGATPGGTVTAGGLTFPWPATATGGQKDNVVSNGQRVAINAKGVTLGFLVSSSWGPATGTGTIVYTDGTAASFSLTSPDWLKTGTVVALKPLYANRTGNTQYNNPAYVDELSVPLDPTRTVNYVILPAVSAAPAANTPTLHIFSLSVLSDTTAPTVTATTTPSAPDGSAGWFVSPTTVTLAATDTGGAGLALLEYQLGSGSWQPYTTPIAVPEGTTVVGYRATDKSGNVSTVGTITVRRDPTAPTVAVSYDDHGGTTTAPVPVTITATDATSGVGSVQYQLDGGDWTGYPGSPVTVSGVGSHTLVVKVTDVAGNTTTKSSTITILPFVTTTLTSAVAPSNGWYTAAVSIALTSNISGDKIQYQLDGGGWKNYSKAVSVSADGVHSLATRLLANSVVVDGSTSSSSVEIDKTAPTAAYVADPGSRSGTPRNPVTASFTAADATSGVVRIEYNIGGGSWTAVAANAPVTFDTVGTFVVGYRSVDNAGLASAVKSSTVTIAADPATSVKLSAAKVAAGGYLTVTVAGYHRYAMVDISLGSTVLSSVPTDVSGTAKVTAVVPAATAAGTYTVTAAEQGSDLSSTASLKVTG